MLIAAPQNKRLETTIKKKKSAPARKTLGSQLHPKLKTPSFTRPPTKISAPTRPAYRVRVGSEPRPPSPPRLFFLLAPPSSAPLRLVPGAEVKLSEQADLHSPMAARMQMKRMVVGWGLAG